MWELWTKRRFIQLLAVLALVSGWLTFSSLREIGPPAVLPPENPVQTIPQAVPADSVEAEPEPQAAAGGAGSESGDPSASEDEGLYYLGIRDGYLAIFRAGSEEPPKITEIPTSALSDVELDQVSRREITGASEMDIWAILEGASQ